MVAALSVIVPTLDEAAGISRMLAALRAGLRPGDEVVIADGGSRDGTRTLAGVFADRVLGAPRSRATQMNAGAAVARGEVLWFVHADTLVPGDAADQLREAVGRGRQWGWFDVRLSGSAPALRVVERAMSWRARLSGIGTGDQGLFVTRSAFEAVGGFPEIPLMEDVAISRALKGVGRPACLRGPLVTSSRRWEEGGIARTVLLMWRLRYEYWRGADPADLARRYR